MSAARKPIVMPMRALMLMPLFMALLACCREAGDPPRNLNNCTNFVYGKRLKSLK
jgi:hypothetical protein